MNCKFICGLILFFLIGIVIVNSGNINDKINPEVYKSLEKNDETKVIVEIKDSKSSFEKKEIKEEVKSIVGNEDVNHEFDKTIAVEINKDDLNKLAKNPDVKKIIIDKPIHAFLQSSVPFVNATNVWPVQLAGLNITGIDETICVIDTGANFSHPDLIGKNKTCVIDCVEKACIENCSIGDDHGHGTHVAGIVAASGGVNGVAVNANLIAVKVLNSAGSGTGSDLNAGIDWCVNNASLYNISVISMSLGDCTNHSTYCNDDDSASHINSAVAKNISVIVAAGNGPGGSCGSVITNVNGPASPACVENATAVGAVDLNDAINFQRGTLFEIMAPGISITSTKSTGGYQARSGTSMAAPHVAGAFSLVRQFFRLQNNRIPTHLEIRNILNSTGKTIYDSGTGNSFSRINIYAAILSIDALPNVTLISPGNNVINSSNNQIFSCNATDNVRLRNLTLQIWNYLGDIYYNQTNQTLGKSLSINANLTNMLKGNYKWNCLAYNENNNFSYANSNFSIYIGNLSVSLTSPANNTFTKQNNTNFTCLSQTANLFILKNSTLMIWNFSESLIYNTTQNISGNSNSSIFYYNLSNEGNYKWNCKVSNNASEWNFADSNFTLTYDVTPPNINLISPADSSSYTSNSQSITFSYNVTDNNGISNCSFIVNNLINLTNSSIANLSSEQSFTNAFSLGTYSWSINCTDYANNKINSSQRNFTVTAPAVVQQQSGGTGSGGGGTPTITTKTYNLSSQQISGGYTQDLNKNDRIIFTFYDKKAGEHTLTVNEVKEKFVNITIRSSSVNLILGIGQSVKLNLTSSDYYDLYIKLESIENSKAKLTIQLINERIEKPAADIDLIIKKNETEEKDLNTEKEAASNLLIKKLKIIIYSLISIFVIILFLWIYVKRKSIKTKVIDEYREIFHKEVKPKNKRKNYEK